ncbi:PEPxxWA-CTERM sorting domain-containing protein [Sphingobium nicotianae]|nr:PEPxxWA-CTERM sorting domain-containing protein [Sphingobium nicotianae]
MTIKTFALAALAGTGLLASVGAQAAPTIDVAEAPTGFFVPTAAQTYDAPYYRYFDGDWGWTHNAIAGSITTASLLISAFDVDPTEIDQIYAYDNGVKTLLGDLAVAPDDYSYTEFVLGANFFDDIAAGLQVFIDIDVGNTTNTWAVTLAKSTLSIDGAAPPNPNPGVPEPATWGMMIAGLAIVGSTMRRRKVAVSFA